MLSPRPVVRLRSLRLQLEPCILGDRGSDGCLSTLVLLLLLHELLFEATRLLQLVLLLALDVALERPEDLDFSQGRLRVVKFSEDVQADLLNRRRDQSHPRQLLLRLVERLVVVLHHYVLVRLLFLEH